MLGDALIYGVSLYALSRSNRWKAGAAAFKGVFIVLLALGIVVDIVGKVSSGVPPSFTLMLVFGAAARIANLISLASLWRFRSHDVNTASTFECSHNDVTSNIGVLIAAAAVAVLASPWPDILIGALMAVIIFLSSRRVLTEAIPQLRTESL